MLKKWLHGLYVAALPVALTVLGPYLLHFQLPAGHEWVMIACALIIPVWGYFKKLAWFGNSATFSWWHTLVVTLLVGAGESAVAILQTGSSPTEAQWLMIGQATLGTLVMYISKPFTIGSSGALTSPPNLSACGSK